MHISYNSKKHFEEIDGVQSDVYYHYTSLNAFYEIVTSRTFRLMSLKSSNDRAELYYSPDDFISDFKNIDNLDEDVRFPEYHKLFIDCLDKHNDEFLKHFKFQKQPYAFCLSSKKDNLTHWDRYADRCTGVSIGLNVRALDVFDNRMRLCGLGLGLFHMGPILYSKEDIMQQIRRDLLRIFYLLNYFKPHQKIEDTIREFGIDPLIPICLNVMDVAKKEAYCDEDEFRVYYEPKRIHEILKSIDNLKGNIENEIYNNLRKHYLEFVKSLNIRDEKFAVTGRGIRGYHELCLNEIWGSGVIPEVILGPMCVQNKDELRRFLDKNGLKGTKIIESSVPIR